jgi:glyoxylase-like metal-dependent hydrolase (beta-lactamase superfamily II)
MTIRKIFCSVCHTDGFFRQFATALLALGLACTTSLALAQKPAVTGPAAKHFQLGALQISVLHDGGFAVPNDASIFATNATAADVAKVLRNAGAPTDKIRLDVDALLIRMPGHLVLIDTGNGPAGHGVLPESLRLAGVSPDQITDVLITHAHSDHVGGLVNAAMAPAFRKATIRMSAKDWAFMQRETGTKAIATAVKTQVKTFDPGQAVLPGITSVSLPGHTPGHVGYEITSQGHRMIDIGDIVHSSIVSLTKPGWTVKWDSDKNEAVTTRRRELQRLAASHQWMFAPHFPFPGVGRIERAGEGFRFQPGLPANQ